MSCSYCLNCERIVPSYEKYCRYCLQKYNLPQDENWHKNHRFKNWNQERLEEVGKDIEKVKKSRSEG